MTKLARAGGVFARQFFCAFAVAAFCVSTPGEGALRISEFLAENDGLVRDEDADTPDWIELKNDGVGPVNLDGWFLTDDAADLPKWRLPAVILGAGEYLVVFASGKDRTNGVLHTSFQLDNAGGYLALVQPDGTTVAHAFAAYPPQRANKSYGTGLQTTTTPLVLSGAGARVLVPVDDAFALAWTLPNFDDTGWMSGPTGVGYDSAGSALSIDINDRSFGISTNTQPGFESFLIGSVGSATAIQTNATTRVFGTVSVTISNTPPQGYDDRQRGTPVNNPPFVESQLFRDMIFSRSSGTDTGGLDVVISGLTASARYQITIFSYDSSSLGNRVSDWFANGMLVKENYTFGNQGVPTGTNDYRFDFDAVSDATGRIVVSGRRDATSANQTGTLDFGVFLNGLQIAQASYLSQVGTDVRNAMQNQNASAYVRVLFSATNPAVFQQLKLRVKYDDGFAAYINGQLVASRAAPLPLTWDSAATGDRPKGQALAFEEILLANPPGLLTAGVNVLAIHGLNVSVADSDFLILPELEALSTAEYSERYFAVPTPGADNGAGYVGLVADTRFSVDRGFYDGPFSLSLTTATENAEIWFTRDGRDPAPGQGTLFTAPLAITNTAFVRAAAFKPGLIPSDVDTHSYIFLDQVIRQPNNLPGYPAIWPDDSYPADYGMDPNVVNHPTYALTIKNDLRAVPTLSIVTAHENLWDPTTGIYLNANSRGEFWERTVSAELIAGDGTTEFSVNCGLRMQGNASRDNQRTPKHSFRMLFKHERGPSKLNYDWFAGPDNVDQFDNIVLRASGFVDGWASRYSDTTPIGSTGYIGVRYRPETAIYLKDVWFKDAMRDMGWTSGRSTWVHLYLNGVYWGLFNSAERYEAQFVALRFGGREEDWDVLVGHDTLNIAEVVDGNTNDWGAMMRVVNAGITNEAAYQAVGQLVEIDNLVDYMLLHFFGESEDWPHHNWYAAHRRATNGLPATKWIFLVWDQELSLDRLVRRNRTDVGTAANHLDSPARIYARLRAWPEFRRLFGDRVHKHLFNTGALAMSNNIARMQARVAEIDRAIVGESARWGDAREFATPGNPATGKTFTRDEWWLPELNQLYTNFFMTLNEINVDRLRAAGLYPAVSAPEFNQFGGPIPNGFGLEMVHTNPAGVIYFTSDGSDPRVYGTGAVAPNAQGYSEPVIINLPTLVRARVLNGATWSALVETAFYPPQDLSRLALTEIMYNPPAMGTIGGDDLEFVELKNTGTNVLNLSGLILTGINFTFTNGTLLAPGEFFVLVRNPTTFTVKYPGVPMDGVFTGRLDNGGETLRLAHAFGTTVFGLEYDDVAPWPVASDNYDFSIVQPGLTQAPDRGSNWRASALPGGSPGADDPMPNIPAVVINEVLSASVPPLLDSVELFNPAAQMADVSAWFLTDDLALPAKFRIPDGTQIPSGGYVSFNETQLGFALSSHGEQIYLLSANTNGNLTGYSHGFNFGPAGDNVSFGRYVNSTGEEQFPAQISRTLLAANSGPRVGPIVINEIHYHPSVDGDEFIELLNITSTNVPLYDVAYPEITWGLNGAGFAFPTNLIVPPNAYVLVVATNPADFRAKYGIAESVAIVGPYSGALQDSGERLKLERPGVLDTNGLPFIVVDEVRYNDKAPWPPGADGAGPSLQRRNAQAYGDDPINWLPALPTPGAETGLPDSDGDGLPDEWEIIHGTNPAFADASDDPDGDGATNLDEFRAATNPQDPASSLKLLVSWDNGVVVLSFEAAADKGYLIVWKENLGPGMWSELRAFPAMSIGGARSTTDPIAVNTTRFYRLLAQ